MATGDPLDRLCRLSPGVTDVGLQLPSDTSLERWAEIGEALICVGRAANWWIGDWIVFGDVYAEGERARGDQLDALVERYERAREMTGLTRGTLMNVRSVAARVPLERRRADVTFWLHAEVAKLEPAVQSEWLEQAAAGGWSRTQLREAVTGRKAMTRSTVDPRLVEAVDRLVAGASRLESGDYVVGRDPLLMVADLLGVELPSGNVIRLPRWPWQKARQIAEGKGAR